MQFYEVDVTLADKIQDFKDVEKYGRKLSGDCSQSAVTREMDKMSGKMSNREE